MSVLHGTVQRHLRHYQTTQGHRRVLFKGGQCTGVDSGQVARLDSVVAVHDLSKFAFPLPRNGQNDRRGGLVFERGEVGYSGRQPAKVINGHTVDCTQDVALLQPLLVHAHFRDHCPGHPLWVHHLDGRRDHCRRDFKVRIKHNQLRDPFHRDPFHSGGTRTPWTPWTLQDLLDQMGIVFDQVQDVGNLVVVGFLEKLIKGHVAVFVPDLLHLVGMQGGVVADAEFVFQVRREIKHVEHRRGVGFDVRQQRFARVPRFGNRHHRPRVHDGGVDAQEFAVREHRTAGVPRVAQTRVFVHHVASNHVERRHRATSECLAVRAHRVPHQIHSGAHDVGNGRPRHHEIGMRLIADQLVRNWNEQQCEVVGGVDFVDTGGEGCEVVAKVAHDHGLRPYHVVVGDRHPAVRIRVVLFVVVGEFLRDHRRTGFQSGDGGTKRGLSRRSIHHTDNIFVGHYFLEEHKLYLYLFFFYFFYDK